MLLLLISGDGTQNLFSEKIFVSLYLYWNLCLDGVMIEIFKYENDTD